MAIKTPTLRKKDQTPTRQVEGTTYTAATEVKPPSYEEIGSAAAAPIREVVPELLNRRQASQTYKKMTRSDASTKVSLRAGKAPVLGGNYYIDPFDESDFHQSIGEFIDFNIFHAMTTPWLSSLQEICHFMEDGASVVEPCYELREWAPKKTNAAANRRKYTMLRKLAPRPMTTITEFMYDDNGGPVGIKQNAIDSKGNVKEKEIEIDKLIIFTFDKEGGNLEGESILRSAYAHWFYKNVLYKIDAIQKERHGIGVPDIELGPGHSKKDRELAHEMGRNLRTNENSYIVRTKNMVVGFAELKTKPMDVMDSINHHDNMIMKNVMVQFLNLGIEGAGGGRATGATAADMFLKSMRHIANLICDYFNQYLIPNLVAYNFKTDQFPKMKVRNVGEVKDLQMWASAMGELVKNNIITVDLETEQFVRGIIDFPKKLGQRPELLPSQIRENILLQGQYEGAGAAKPGETKTDGGVIIPGQAQGGPPKTGNIGKSPTSGE